MILTLLSVTLIIASVLGVLRIVGRHARVLASIDVTSIPAERHAAVKDAIIASRIRRRLSSLAELLSIISEPLLGSFARVKDRMDSFRSSVIRIKEEYRSRTTVGGSKISDPQNLPIPERLEKLLEEASDFSEKELFREAEKKYIAALAVDSKYLPAYEGLCDLYSRQKEWGQASEVSEYVCKLYADSAKMSEIDTPKYAECLYDLSELYIHLDRPHDALKALRKALKIQASNPKYLNALIETYISLKMRLKAEHALDELKAANPENQKISEIAERIAALSY